MDQEGKKGVSTVHSWSWSPSLTCSSGPSNLYVAPAHIIFSVYTQQAIAEGEQLSWVTEKRLLLQRLECLQQAIARLEHEKTELKQLNAELRRTLEQVKQAFTASPMPHGLLEQNTTHFHILPFGVLWFFTSSPTFLCGHTLSCFPSLGAIHFFHRWTFT